MLARSVSPPPRILIIEDDHNIGSLLTKGLRAAGFAVSIATDGDMGLQQALAGGADLVVLDLNLPGQDGLSVLEACRSRIATPFLVLTARITLDARTRSFELGAVDYLAKPFYMEELVARIRARLGTAPAAPERRVVFADVEVRLDARTVLRDGLDIGLTAGETNLLLWLVGRPDRPASRAQIVAATFPPDSDATDRTVDSYVAHVRRKLGAEAAAYVQTVFGVGYCFRVPR